MRAGSEKLPAVVRERFLLLRARTYTYLKPRKKLQPFTDGRFSADFSEQKRVNTWMFQAFTPPQKHSPSPWCPLSQGKIFLKVEKELNFHFFAAAADVKASAAV